MSKLFRWVVIAIALVITVWMFIASGWRLGLAFALFEAIFGYTCARWGKELAAEGSAEGRKLISSAEGAIRKRTGGFATIEVIIATGLCVVATFVLAQVANPSLDRKKILWDFLYWICYLIGSASHAWTRASVIIRNPTNPIAGYREYAKKYAPVLVERFLWGTGIFVMGIFVGYGLDQLAPGGISLGNPVGKCVASLFIGLGIDNLLYRFTAKYEWAKDAVPQAPGSTQFQQDLSGAKANEPPKQP